MKYYCMVCNKEMIKIPEDPIKRIYYCKNCHQNYFNAKVVKK